MSIAANFDCYRFCGSTNDLCFPNLVTIAIFVAILFVVGSLLLGLAIFNLNSFLAKNAPVATEILVVEGWLPDYAVAAAMAEFNHGRYTTLITVGAPLPRGSYLSEYKTCAELAAATLVALGFNPDQLQIVPTTADPQDRTYHAAMALKHHFTNSIDLPIRSINVFTLGAHARRTQLVFRKVFPTPIQVGIISTKVLAYDERVWWKSSEGVRTVIGETIAYLYQRCWG